MKDDDELEKLLGEIPHATSSFSAQPRFNNATNHHPQQNGTNHHPQQNGTYHHPHQNDTNHHHHQNGTNHHHHQNVTNHHQNHHHQNHGYGHASHGYGHASHVTTHQGDDESLKHKYAFASSPVSGFSLTSGGSSSSLFSGGGRAHSDFGSPPQFESHFISGNGFCLDSNKASESDLVDYLNLSRNFSKMYVRDEREGVTVPPYGFQYYDQSVNGVARNVGNNEASHKYSNGFSYHMSAPSSPMVEMQYDQRMASLIGSRCPPSPSERLLCWSDIDNSSLPPQFYRNSGHPMGFVVPNASPLLDNTVGNPVFYPPQTRMNLIEASESFYSPDMAPLMSRYNEERLIHLPNGRNKVPMRFRVPRGSVEPFDGEDSLAMQGEGINYRMTKHKNRPQLNGNLHSAAISKIHCPFNRPSKFTTLSEAQGCIYHTAKDQQGCRFLQKMFDEGTALDVQIIFSEIIDHVVELMMNPFGNYLMQKLLEVCNEEQRIHILFRVTEEPGELVRISLNTHGTRVVQKLIETLKTKQQISLVSSALEPGFLALIKDLNGNHVIQRCLQCFPIEDSKFIFVAAAKYCVDIATHQHGCCVLQRCISHSVGEHRENLVAEISANGLLLAEDAYGNYVVQFILDLQIPYATATLTSQFEGNYAHLSTQKFSSHVVEKCLSVCDEEIRSKIIHELLSASCFDQLLQDPHANYVVQTALRVSQGHIHHALVDAIESYKAISRNSPYSKRIFSQKLMKK